jgi:hypothetical protein
MPQARVALEAFNRGIISKYALGRVDLQRTRLSAETMTNWLPMTLGPMMLRPGTEYVGETKSSAAAEFIPFAFSSDETAEIELTADLMRVRVDEDLVSRPAVSTAITSGTFLAALGWTLANSGGASSSIAAGLLTLAGVADGGLATATQSVTVSVADQSVAHGIRIIVERGPVVFRVGTTSGGDDIVNRLELETGTHSLSVTPGASPMYIQFASLSERSCRVESIEVEAAGVVEIPTTWDADDLDNLRWEQSGDIIFVACEGQKQKCIERRGDTSLSWSLVDYRCDDGPFMADVTIPDISFTPSATTGDITLTCNRDFFQADHVGALFRLFQTTQSVDEALGALDATSSTVRIFGVNNTETSDPDGTNDRIATVSITGTWVGTIALERSFESESTGFVEVTTFTANTNYEYTDDFDNLVVWLRLRMKLYTSGTADVTMAYPGGGGYGIVRVVGFSTAQSVAAQVVETLTSTKATDDWLEGQWSEVQGYPTSVCLFDGRLWWFGQDREWGSVSDAYFSHNIDVDGDSGPLNRTIGMGPVEAIRWALPLQRLIIGTASAEISVRSSSFDEPITPTNFTQKACSRQGAANVRPAMVDARGVFVQRSGRRVIEVSYSLEANDYKARDLTRFVPDLAGSNIVSVCVQRQPDTRIHCALEDGSVIVLLYEPDEEVICWFRTEIGGSGIVERVFVQPGEVEDRVYYLVRRTIDGDTKRYLERHALMSQARGGTDNRIADCHLVYSGSAVTTITGLDHLEGEEVVCWGNGKDLGEFTVAGGQITGLSEAVTTACVGLAYTATYKSAKLAYAAEGSTALTQTKKLERVGLILADVHYRGLSVGQDVDHLDLLPLIEDDALTPVNTVWADFDKPTIPIDGTWTTDARLCLQAAAPRPATVVALAIQVSTNG